MKKILSSQDINYVLEKYNEEIPVQIIANKLDCSISDVTKELRKRGKLRDILSIELNDILNKKDRIPLYDLRKEFGFTKTQFSQICSRYDIGKKMKSTNEYTEEEIILKTKYLLEKKLNFIIDDILVKKLSSKIIIDAGGSYLIDYANEKKKQHKVYKYFSSVAYLFNLAYPNQFRPCQFIHSPYTKDYFSRKIYLGELVIIMEDKMKINLNNINTLKKSNGFLKKSDLEFYGIGQNVYTKLFGDKKEMIRQLLIHLDKKDNKQYENTNKLTEKLIDEGINPRKCYCKECNNSQIDIHHIYPKRFASNVNFDIDSIFNLIPLCKEHHSMVRNMEVEKLDFKDKDNWRSNVIEYLNNLNKN